MFTTRSTYHPPVSESIAETASSPPPAVGWRAQTPNAITVARIGLAIGFVAMLSILEPTETNLRAAAGVFVLAALSDALDGYLARRWNAISRFGRVADPLADKVLVLAAFMLMAGPELGPRTGVAPWMVVLILARELLVTSIRAVFEADGVDFSASWSGKIKMIAQSVAVPLILLLVASDAATPVPGALGIAWAVTVLTVVSGLPYILRAMTVSSAGGTP